MITINLQAIQRNWNKIESASCASVAAVIKANAYGLGATEIGIALAKVGCKDFFVASLEEGMAAKKNLPQNVRIFVLGGIRPGDEQYFVDFGLLPVLCSMADVHRWSQVNLKFGKASPCVIKVNTGMTRLGLDAPEFADLCDNVELVKNCSVTLLMSHLACAEDKSHPLNIIQLNKFKKFSEKIHSAAPNVRLSLANSSGIFLGADWHFDLVRPGAALYGIAPQLNQQNPMMPVVNLALPIVQVRKLQEHATIGYGAEVMLPPGSRIAVVAGGYADGINRTLGPNPEGFLCGYAVKSVGRISMDLTMFDVSSVALSDDELMSSSIEVINETLSIDYLSKKNGALGYEVLTSLGARYKRKYIGGIDG